MQVNEESKRPCHRKIGAMTPPFPAEEVICADGREAMQYERLTPTPVARRILNLFP
jgi:hypothetical protein